MKIQININSFIKIIALIAIMIIMFYVNKYGFSDDHPTITLILFSVSIGATYFLHQKEKNITIDIGELSKRTFELKLNKFKKPLFYRRFRIKKNKNSNLSKKSIALTVKYLHSERDKTSKLHIFIYTWITIQVSFSFLMEVNYGVIIFCVLISALAQMRYLILMYRIRSGYFGLNKYEALMLIGFIKKNIDDVGGPGGKPVKVFADKELEAATLDLDHRGNVHQ